MSLKGFETFEILDSTGSAQGIAISGEAVVYSKIFTLGKHEYFGLAYQASSGGTISLKLEIQNSIDGVNFITPDDVLPIDSEFDDSGLHIRHIQINRSPYVRFKITGLTENAATTKLKIWLIA